MRRRRGGPFLGPLGCLWSRTHLSLRKSAEETLESDIHPPSTSPSLHFRDAMHDGHCHSAGRVTSLSLLCLSPSLFLCLGENINAVVLLADIHTTPTPFNEIHQLWTPYREKDDNSYKKATNGRKKDKKSNGFSLLGMGVVGWSLIICKEMKQCVFLMWG